MKQLKKWNAISVSLISAVIFVTTILLFDWNWFRPSLERYISQKSHRIVKADDLQIAFTGFLHPTIKLRNLYIQNAAWSSKRPFIAVKEISFSFASFGMLFSDKRVIVEISMSDGEVNLERLSDGLRNWRLLEPEYRGPGKYIVMSLQTNRSTIRFIDHKNMLNLVAQSSPTASASTAKASSNQINFKGTYRNSGFIGEAITSQTISFQKTGKKFPIVGNVKAGGMDMRINGEIGDILKDQLIDADIQFSTPSIAAVNPFLNTHFPQSHAIQAQAHVIKTGNEYLANHLRGKIGSSNITGDIAYINNKKQPLFKGSLSTKELHLTDLVFTSQQKEDRASQKNAPNINLPNSKIPTEMLKSHDVNLSLNVSKLISAQLPPIENLYVKVDFKNGDLKLTPIKATLFGSPINAELLLNTQLEPAAAKVVIDIQHLAIDKLTEKSSLQDMISAPLTAHINVHGIGNSLQNLLDSASGKMNFVISKGEISNKLDAKMGLDAGKLVWLTIKGDKNIVVNNAEMKIDFKNGIGQSQKMAIDTSQTHIEGTGNINLHNQTLDFLLTPKPKDPTLFSVHSNIHIYGAINKPKFELEDKHIEKDSISIQQNIAQQGAHGLK